MEISSWSEDADFMNKRWAAYWKSHVKKFPKVVTFVVGHETVKETIECLELLLCVASPVLEDFISQQGSLNITMKLPDVDISAFKKFLKYINQESLEDSVPLQEACHIFSLARRFEIPELQNHYSNQIQHILSKTTAITIYQVASEIKDPSLQFLAQNFILSFFEDIMESDEFLWLDANHLHNFLAADTLCVYSELDLFKALKRWGEKQCGLQGKEESPENLRQVLKKVIYCIRIPTMTLEEFVSIVEPSNLLAQEDTKSLVNYFAKRQANRNYQAETDTLKFSTEMRHCKKEDLTVTFYLQREFGETITDFSQEYISERFRITENCGSIYLKAVGFANPLRVPDLVIMKIENEATQEILAVTEKSFGNVDGDIFVEFDSPVHMKLKITYKISYKTASGGLCRLSGETMKQERNHVIFRHPHILTRMTSVELLDVHSSKSSKSHKKSHKRRKVEKRNANKNRYIHSLKFSF